MGYNTILGAGGVAANGLAKLLLKDKQSVRLVSRTGYTIPGMIVVKA